MPEVKKDCMKCIHKGKCNGWWLKTHDLPWDCPTDKQFIPAFTKRKKSIKASKVTDRKTFDDKYL